LSLEEGNKSLEIMPGQDLSRQLMSLPARERLNAILERVDAESVVQGFAVQDFYFSVQELGSEDALPLLALAGLEQINHLFDVEWWQKDSIVPSKAVESLDRLARASESRLLQWLHHADFELLVMLFKKWMSVHVAKEDEDALEVRDRLPLNTLDDTYYWEIHYPQYEDFVRNLLGMLFEVNQSFYRELMDHILYAVDVEVEEDAYRYHRGRLEDNAIPDFYDALEIYRPLTHLHTREKRGIHAGEGEDPQPPSFALALVPQGDFLGEALGRVKDSSLANGLQLELAALSNKVLVADQLPPENAESLRHAVGKAIATVNLGLELYSRGNHQEAAGGVKEIMLEDLFRVGHSQAVLLQRKLKELVEKGWISRWPSGLQCLDFPWREKAELLLGKTPRVPRRQSPDGSILETDFLRTQKDVRRSLRLIKVLQALEPLQSDFHISWEELELILWPEGQIREVQDVTLGVLVLTAAAGFITRGTWAPFPLEVKAWEDIFPLLTGSRVKRAVKEWHRHLVPDPKDASRVEIYLKSLLDEYDREMEGFSEDNVPDPQFVKFFLFTA